MDWDLRVEGAGEETANGYYKQDGELDGKSCYKKVRSFSHSLAFAHGGLA